MWTGMETGWIEPVLCVAWDWVADTGEEEWTEVEGAPVSGPDLVEGESVLQGVEDGLFLADWFEAREKGRGGESGIF